MPSPRRIERLAQLIHETAATTVQRDLADPRLGFVTVTRVRLAPDLSLATVFWSCLGGEAQRRTSERALASARRRVQSVVAGALGTRVTPEIRFQFDESLEKAAHLEDIFERLRRERSTEPGSESPDSETPDSETPDFERSDASGEVSDAPPAAPPAPPAPPARETGDDADE